MLINLFILSIIQFLFLFVLNKLAYKVNFLDYPNKRKVHEKPTPYIGGLALSLSFCIVVYISKIEYQSLNLILLFATIISVVGFVDDKFDINPFIKLILQSIPVYILISMGLYLNDIGEYGIIGKINLGNYSEIFTFLSCLLIINAFNYMDGVDGLLSSLFINIFSYFAIVCYFFDKIFVSQILVYLIHLVIIFFLFNISFLKLPKIFLGDSGSTLLGFITGFVMIFLYTELSIEPPILIWPVALVIYDFLSTSLLRVLKKKKDFKSGNDHIHHQISMKYNLKKLENILIINLINYFFIFICLIIYFFLGSFFSLLGFVIFFLIYLIFKFHFINSSQ